MTAGERPGLAEILGVWALFGIVALLIAVTYARLPPGVLYHVDDTGVRGGLGRALVFLNFSTILAAIPIVLVARERLPGRTAAFFAGGAIALCAVTGAPGVVEQDDLDAKLVNAVPALGVVIALGLTLAALRNGGLGPVRGHAPGDRIRVGLGAVLLVGAIPWIAAEIGFYVGRPFLAREIRPEPGSETLRAVHLGHHHGLDGVLLALTAIALSRVLPELRPTFRRGALTVYLSLLFVYGLANAVQDFWTEQVVKRGWVDASLPSMLRPGLTPAWAGILVAAAVVYVVVRYRLPRAAHGPPAPRVST